ncbi:prepilin peptidase [Patescibacteria group bacterium]|nr:prepilin peptidase [Patescibacteria group bacterium]
MSYNKNMLTHVFIIVFGAAVGSFLNVVIFRLNSGESFLGGESRCFSCGKKLKWRELVPVFSFLIQKGRCRGCGSKISWQYPAVEIITGVLFLATFQLSKFNFDSCDICWFLYPYIWLLVSLLIIIAVYDLRHFIIPNKIVWIFNVLAFLNLLAHTKYAKPGFAFLSGVVFFLFFAALWFLSKGKWMGFGDAKLALGLGWLLGPVKTFSAFLISFWLGAFVGLLLIVLKKGKYTMMSRIPFAPFLIAGSLLSFFINFDILSFFNF